MSARCLAWLAAGLLALGSGGARAQTGSASYSVWSLNGQRLTLRFMLPVADANRVAGTDIDVLTASRFSAYLLDHVAVRANGEECPPIDQGYDIGKVDPLVVGAGLTGFEIFFQCEHPTNLVLEDHALFDRLPGQVNFARLQVNGGPIAQQLFTDSQQHLTLAGTRAARSASTARYLSLGSRHVFGGLDRLCFLLAMLLLVPRLRALGPALAVLAIGYLVSLPFALAGPLTARTPLLEAFLGFLVALLAAQQVARQLERPRLLAIGAAGALLWLAAMALFTHAQQAAWLLAGAALFAGGYLSLQRPLAPIPGALLLACALFGFLDGCLLPTELLPMRLAGHTELPMLVGFDLGTWLAEALVLLVLLVVAAAVRLLRRQPRALMRSLLQDVATAGLGGVGVFWLITRL